MSKVWFITGCSSGFGRMLAEYACGQGDSVVATARSVQSMNDIGKEDEQRILRLPLDVRNDLQIHDAVARTIEKFGRIDVLVNNAGYGYFAMQEEADLNEIRAMYDTNVFGLIAMTKAVLPLLRKQKGGVVVNLSSIAGRIATPRGGFYQSTKWAVEALSEALYLEVCGFGIRVVVIEPGAYETDFGPRSSRVAEAEGDPNSPYAGLRAMWREHATRHLFPYRQQPQEVVRSIIDAVESHLPFIKLPVGQDAISLIADREDMSSTDFVEQMRKIYYEGER